MLCIWSVIGKSIQTEQSRCTYCTVHYSYEILCAFYGFSNFDHVRPPLWSSGRVPGYRSRDPRFHSRRYQIFWEVVCLERGPLSLVSKTEELLEYKNSGSGSIQPRLKTVGIRCADHAIPSICKMLALNSPTCDGLSVGVVHLRTTATEFSV
jgi:hypothetical protein